MGSENRVRWVSREMQAILRPCMTNGIIFLVAVCLIEKMHLTTDDDCSRGTESIRFTWLLGIQCGLFFPNQEILAGCHTYTPLSS